MSGVSLRGAEVYHCPFCGGEDLRPVEEPRDGWSCSECARVFSVRLVALDEAHIPGRQREEAELQGRAEA
jgi:hypothetical protein